MSTAKTQPTNAEVQAHLASKASPAQLADCQALLALLARVTGQGPRMWGPSIVGFGEYHYRYDSGRTGSACLTGFAVRGRELVVYLMADPADQSDPAAQASLLARLGPHKLGKACLYFKRLADLDLTVLEQLVAASVAGLRQRYPESPGQA